MRFIGILAVITIFSGSAQAAEAICAVEGTVETVEQVIRPVNILGAAQQQAYIQVKLALDARTVLEHGAQEEDACRAPAQGKKTVAVYELLRNEPAVNEGDVVRAKTQFRHSDFWVSTVLYDVGLVAR